MTAHLLLISHAATSAQRHAAFSLDEAVDEREIAKVTALTWSAPRVKQVFSAPERRTQQTAEALKLTPTVANELRDCNYGTWSGRSLADVQSHHPEEVTAWLTDPAAAPHGGESILSLIERIALWMGQQRDAGALLAITHPSVIRCAILHALHAPPNAFWRVDIAPLSITDLRFNGRTWTLRSINCAL